MDDGLASYLKRRNEERERAAALVEKQRERKVELGNAFPGALSTLYDSVEAQTMEVATEGSLAGIRCEREGDALYVHLGQLTMKLLPSRKNAQVKIDLRGQRGSIETRISNLATGERWSRARTDGLPVDAQTLAGELLVWLISKPQKTVSVRTRFFN